MSTIKTQTMYYEDYGSGFPAGVDAGIYSDLDGLTRPAIAGFDLGAYEVGGANIRLPLAK